ncbi:hypothetical protein BKA59DRAFT_517222 [Fusarium tricinctum]|uniref:Uncharacterized protein n=1 Tax=Fusarium tricinctum TaxID=61284 RepID=A0A8K0RND2_9HYPO|nr:hypothetical protein BKA59DRAFT_517222 [Fusarium tricinctum]
MTERSVKHTPFPLTSSNVHFNTAQNVYPATALYRPSDISEVPTSKLSAALGDQYLVNKKHNDITARILNSPETRRLMMQQYIANTPDRVPELKAYYTSLGFDVEREHAPPTSEDLE